MDGPHTALTELVENLVVSNGRADQGSLVEPPFGTRIGNGGIGKHQITMAGGQISIPMGMNTIQRKRFMRSGAYQKLFGCNLPAAKPRARYTRAHSTVVGKGGVASIAMNVTTRPAMPSSNGLATHKITGFRSAYLRKEP